jgi:mono/diheme cytochrome c family protein
MRFPRIDVLIVVGWALLGVTADRTTPVSAQEKSAEKPGVTPGAEAKTPASKPASWTFEKQTLPLLREHCLACHGKDKQEADLDLSRFTSEESLLAERRVWEGVLEMIESDAMPPADRPRLPATERRGLVRYLERALFNLDCEDEQAIDPGRVTIRRLNRVEYNNTIRDLLGVDFRPADDFPSDDVGHGFDNIGDVLTVSPLLVEKYLAAAERVAASAVAAAEPPQAEKRTRRGRQLKAEGGARVGPFGIHSITSEGIVSGDFELPRDGEYIVRVRAAGQRAGDELPKLQLRIDDKVIQVFDVAAKPDKPADYEVRQALSGGFRRVAAHFINDFQDPTAERRDERDRNLFVGSIEVEGPVDPGPGVTKPARLDVILPSDGRSPREAAAQTLGPLARRAFRRPLQEGELEPFVALTLKALERGMTYPRAIEVSVAALLVSPHFLFRVERDAAPNDPLQKHAVSEWELASRLSYFLWSSMPDEQLLKAAEEGKLREVSQLLEQARRMLKDRRAKALSENFAAQWLNLRSLDEVSPDPRQFPSFSVPLRNDMRRETELLFDSIVRENRSLLDLIDADYSFLNERLAKHYGVGDVEGKGFRRVSLTGTPRAGVLTHASILTLTSNPTRTSPVKRGKWIMENILGTPPPDPPPNAPELSATQKAAPEATLRQALELHRKDPNCAVCHLQMDALGFGFEHFDAVGRWRDQDGKQPIDAGGQLPDGSKFSGSRELVAILKGRKDDFTRTLAERMLTYALGRGLAAPDRCVVEKIVRETRDANYQMASLIEAVVRSEPFRMRRGEESKP